MKERIIGIIVYILAMLAFVIMGIFIGEDIEKGNKVIEKVVIEDELSEWEVMKLALIKTESEWNPLAVGKSEDYGILQITPIYVKEVNRILGEEKYTHEDAFNPKKSMEMFDVYESHHNPMSDVDKAIASHNPTASSAYSIKVRRNMELIRQYEELRKLVR